MVKEWCTTELVIQVIKQQNFPNNTFFLKLFMGGEVLITRTTVMKEYNICYKLLQF